VVTGDEEDHRALLEVYHDAPTARHLGAAKMLRALSQDYWWLEMQKFTQSYISGCARCQESKAITHPNKPLLQPIMLQPNARPFSTIAMDFIVKLPSSKGYNSILTLTDHDCTKVVILLPC
jgi:hypothetical protein